MATTIVNPTPSNNSDNNGMGFLFGAIVLIVLAVLFFMYGLPALRQSSVPQISIPEKIDVNINQESK